MARKVRIEFPGAVYHMMSRGNQGNGIFRSDDDRTLFLKTLGEGCQKTGWRVHAYVLMNNHYHLLLETPEANLVAGMKWLQGVYTQRFNARHKVFGHLLQGRYKAVVVDASAKEYFQVVSTYIHLNPARAGLIRIGHDLLKTYPWSSYPGYLSRPQRRPEWLQVDRVLGSLGIESDDARGRRGYEAYVEGRVVELGNKRSREEMNREWKQIRRGWYLGETSFRQRLEEYIEKGTKGKARSSYSGGARQAHDEKAAEAMLVKGLAAMGLEQGELPGMAKGAVAKQVLAWWLRKSTVVSRQWIAQRLHMGDESRVTHSAALVASAKKSAVQKLCKRLEQLHS